MFYTKTQFDDNFDEKSKNQNITETILALQTELLQRENLIRLSGTEFNKITKRQQNYLKFIQSF